MPKKTKRVTWDRSQNDYAKSEIHSVLWDVQQFLMDLRPNFDADEAETMIDKLTEAGAALKKIK